MRTRIGAAAAAMLLAGAPRARPPGQPQLRSAVNAITPPTDGLTVDVLNLDDRLLLHNTSGKDVVIEGYRASRTRACRPTAPSRSTRTRRPTTSTTTASPTSKVPTGAGQGRPRGRSSTAPGASSGTTTGCTGWRSRRRRRSTTRTRRTKIFDWKVPIDGRRRARRDRRHARLGAAARRRAADRRIAGAALVRSLLCIGVFAICAAARDAGPAARARGGLVIRARSSSRWPRAAARARRAGRRRARAARGHDARARRATLDRAPGQVVLRFSEPVETAFGAVRVFDATGRQVQQGEPFHPGGRGDAGRGAAAGRPRGRRLHRRPTASSRPTRTRSRAASCSASATGAGAGGSVADLLGGQPGRAGDLGRVRRRARASSTRRSRSRSARWSLLLARWLPALAARRRRSTAGRRVPAPSRRWRGCAIAAARRARPRRVAGARAAGRDRRGHDVWSALGDAREVLDHPLRRRLGPRRARLARSCARAVRAGGRARAAPAAAGAALARRRAGAARRPAGWLALLPALGGHAGVQDPVAVLLPANVVHVLAAGAGSAGSRRSCSRCPPRRAGSSRPTARALLAAVVGRFSALALDRRRAAAGRRHRPVAPRARARSDDLSTRRSAARSSIKVGARRRAARARRGQPPPHPAARCGAPRTRVPRRAARACCCAARCAPRSRSASPRSPSPARSPATRPPTAVGAGPVLAARRPRPRARRADRRARARRRQRGRTSTSSTAPTGASTTRPKEVRFEAVAARQADRADRARRHEGRARPLRRRRRRAVPAGRLAPRARRAHHGLRRAPQPTYKVPIE